MATDKKRSASAKKVWERIRAVAEERGITVQEARQILAAQKQGKPYPKEKRVTEAPAKPKTVDLHAAEKALREKYPHVVPGTLRLPTDGSKKRSVEIVCQHPGCKARRRVFTSDLFQVKYCVEHTQSRRKRKKPS